MGPVGGDRTGMKQQATDPRSCTRLVPAGAARPLLPLLEKQLQGLLGRLVPGSVRGAGASLPRLPGEAVGSRTRREQAGQADVAWA